MKENIGKIKQLLLTIIIISLLMLIINILLLSNPSNLENYINLFFNLIIFILSQSIYILINKINLNTKENSKLKNSNLLEKILDNIDVAVYLRDENFNIIYFNASYAKLALTDEKLIDSHSLEIDKLTKETAIKAKQLKLKQYNERYIIINGRRCFYQFIDTYLDKEKYICSIAYDVTSKAEIARELELNINSQIKLMESSNNAVVIFDADRKVKYYNQPYLKLWGFKDGYLETAPKYEEILEKLHYERKMTEYINFTEFKQSRINFFTTLTDIYNDFMSLPDGKLLRLLIIPHNHGGLLFSFEDMTDHFALQQAYNTLIKVQHTTLNSLQESICVFSSDGTLTLYNSKFKELWNLDQSFLSSNPTIFELVNYYIEALITKNDISDHKNNIIKVLDERKMIEEYITRTDNEYIKRNIVPLPDGAIMISDLNVTASALVEQSLIDRTRALEDADYIKSEFLSNVSYEFRSPLTSIIGYGEILKREKHLTLNEVNKIKYVEPIIESAQKLCNLIDDIIDLAAVESGKIQLNKSNIDIIRVIKNSINSVKKLAEYNNIECVINYDKKLKYNIDADEKRFKQAIIKLLSNAIEYSIINSKVFIDIGYDNNYLKISISNYGNEIRAEEQEFVFHKFYQGKNIKTTGRSGTGIGLSIVKEIIELHDGIIKFSSNRDLGTTFICRLPVINQEKNNV